MSKIVIKFSEAPAMGIQTATKCAKYLAAMDEPASETMVAEWAGKFGEAIPGVAVAVTVAGDIEMTSDVIAAIELLRSRVTVSKETPRASSGEAASWQDGEDENQSIRRFAEVHGFTVGERGRIASDHPARIARDVARARSLHNVDLASFDLDLESRYVFATEV